MWPTPRSRPLMRRAAPSSATTWCGSSRSPGATSPRPPGSPGATAPRSTARTSDRPRAAGDKDKALKLAEENVRPLIDFREATRLAVGRAWAQASKEQQEKLVSGFRRMLVRTYSNALGRYEGQTMKVMPSHYK